MKTKLLITLLVIALVSSIAFGVVACTPDKNNDDGDKNKGKNTVVIETLPDMVDYGADSKYYADGKVGYSDSKILEWTGELETKQDEERVKWIESDDASYWPDTVEEMREFYVTFGTYAEDIDSEGEIRLQSAIGYFDVEGNWVDDEAASTIQRLFAYSTASDFIDRMDSARVDENRTDGLIKYIVRNDDAYVLEEGKKRSKNDYEFRLGYASALEDYDQLDELQTIYDDFTEYEKDTSYASPRFETEEEVQDYINRKKRKIYGEIFTIFEDKADQFARCAIQLVSYGIQIIDDVMMPAYDFHNGDGSEVTFEDYIRYEMFDHETLSYFLAFMDAQITSFNSNTYQATQKSKMMSLYGYYYQYQKGDYEVFDDSKTVDNERLGRVTEYEDFLELNHKDYFDTSDEALRYRDYDRRQYAEAYRYSYNCYTKYYTVQLNFQSIQEEKDLEVYVGGAGAIGDSLVNGQYGTAKMNGLDTVGSGLTYSGEMQSGCSMGLESSLKLSDVNWEYTGVDTNVLRYNNRAKAWNGLSEAQQDLPANKIKKVDYEIAQLESQQYAITHKTIEHADLTKALQYQIYSYSADSIRSIQAAKKDEVTYYLAIDRFLATVPYDYEQIVGGGIMVPEYVKVAFAELEEDAGRNDAKFNNLDANYTVGTARDQANQANNADWAGIKDNIAKTLATDFNAYHKSDANNVKSVDIYFEDTLIRKVMSCGAVQEEPCLDGTSHLYCDEEYDTDWALSRLLDTHEVVLRYMAGQAVVTFKQVTLNDFTDPTKFHKDIKSMPSGTIVTATEAKAAKKYSMTYVDAKDTITLGTSDEIGTACTTVTDGKYPVVGTASQYWDNVPVYESTQFACVTEAGKVNTGRITLKIDNVEYVFSFVGWYVDENFKYGVLLDETYNYDLRLYPGYILEKVVK